MRATHPRAFMLVTRWAHGEYLAIHLAIGFVVCLAIIAMFAAVTEGLVDSSPLTRFDVAIAARLQESAATSALDRLRFLSALGGRGAMTILLLAGAAWFAEHYDVRQVLLLGRVTSGEPGPRLRERAQRVLVDVYPDVAARLNLHLPDEKDRRHGQAVAAASLPVLSVPSVSA